MNQTQGEASPEVPRNRLVPEAVASAAKTKKKLSCERSITELTPPPEKGKARQYASVRMSSRDRDPAALKTDPLKEQKEALEFTAFDPLMEPPKIDASIYQHFGVEKPTDVRGFTIETSRDFIRPRPETPWWVAVPHLLRLLVAEEDVLTLRSRLDGQILYDYYVLRREDKQIVKDYRRWFRVEHERRYTKTPKAVTKRRLRLVAEGDQKFGPKPSAWQDHVDHWTTVRNGPDRKTARKLVTFRHFRS